ncbi:hypothetical protein HPC49_28365 [Pyxidicoccus fallax]|uniref:Uncharacterized protein n=1 Tax=Pyxidicoccus fallax TaxID=394095 RepID=A0A848LN15_9BACT|nr:hypothetical protein [Pyxidicoccus fallax]NMO19060.1 hypothetical protein [Pyxidicoccus fallax]NPC82119.1 hypothetical protein [Pyxidicoccus fallax]
MKREAMGLLAGLMLGAQATAWGAGPASPTGPDTESVPGERKELTGRVLGASPGILYVESAHGPAVPLRVTHATRLAGRRIPREQSVEAFLRQSLPPGSPVRATFDVRTHPDGTPENVASTVDRP